MCDSGSRRVSIRFICCHVSNVSLVTFSSGAGLFCIHRRCHFHRGLAVLPNSNPVHCHREVYLSSSFVCLHLHRPLLPFSPLSSIDFIVFVGALCSRPGAWLHPALRVVPVEARATCGLGAFSIVQCHVLFLGLRFLSAGTLSNVYVERWTMRLALTSSLPLYFRQFVAQLLCHLFKISLNGRRYCPVDLMGRSV